MEAPNIATSRPPDLLKRARLQRGLSLSKVATLTCLSPRIVRQLDEGLFAELPGGVYARSYVRAFAAAVGLDPDEAVHALAAELPEPGDPLRVLRETADLSTPGWIRDLRRQAARLSALCGVTDLSPETAAPAAPRHGMPRAAALTLELLAMLAVYAASGAAVIWTTGSSLEEVVRGGWIGLTGGVALLTAVYVLVGRAPLLAQRPLRIRIPAAAADALRSPFPLHRQPQH